MRLQIDKNCKEGRAIHNRIVLPIFICILICITLSLVLCGCKKKRDNPLENEPVIPLVNSDAAFNGMAVGDNAVLSTNKEMTIGSEKVKEDDIVINNDNYPLIHLEGELSEYELSGVQLSEDELEYFTDYFNKDEINSYLCQIYLIPMDYDETVENTKVDIMCVAGSYDTNGLYSVFYKKADDNSLWNIMFRENNDGYVFHSNQKCSDK